MPQRTMSNRLSGWMIVAPLLAACTMPGSMPSTRMRSSTAAKRSIWRLEVPVARCLRCREVRHRPLKLQTWIVLEEQRKVSCVVGRDAHPIHAGVDHEMVAVPTSQRKYAAAPSAIANSRVATDGRMSCSMRRPADVSGGSESRWMRLGDPGISELEGLIDGGNDQAGPRLRARRPWRSPRHRGRSRPPSRRPRTAFPGVRDL